ncbi:hypothetical protein ONB66_00025 [Candidatus Vidania fulgoroideae]|uniref:50S ribosomal protein L25 n=1 Tax=Candidatus Vidania fulgoroideorum TaxID=881286 RepID=A0AAX3NB96_9PROT|nr:hypothetical protein ONB67_00855 [Candidatus Vidania fulgoroideae]WDR79410.1 hypothetical protein ONB66_00025 [Candidatus Vidania fulgoroideae]
MFKKIKSIKRKINKKNNNMIPAIIYGKKIKNINIYIKKKKIKYGFYKIYYERKKIKSILKNIQYNPKNNKIIHVDFYKINKNKNILEIPIKIKCKKKINYILNKKKIKLICKKIPKNIKISLDKYINKNIRINQIKIPKHTKHTKQNIEENPIIISKY